MKIQWAGSEESFYMLEVALKRIENASAETLKLAQDWEDDQDEEPSTHHMLQVVGELGLIDISGCLVKGSMGWWGQYMGVVGYDDIRNAVIAGLNAGVKSFLVHIDSPGGMVLGIGSLTDFLAQVNRTTPITFYTDTLAASGAVWLASTTNRFKASKHAEVGSVGVIAVTTDATEMFNQMGLKKRVFKSTPLKASGNPNEKLDSANAAEIQRGVDESSQRFIEHIAQGMGLSVGHVSQEIATGQMWYAETALSLGLINGIITFDELVVDLQNKLSQNSNSSDSNSFTAKPNVYAEEDMTKRKLIQTNTPEEALALAASGINVIEASEVQAEEVIETPDAVAEAVVTEEAAAAEAEVKDPAHIPSAVLEAMMANLVEAKVQLATAQGQIVAITTQLETALSNEQGLKKVAAVAVQRAYVASGSTPPSEDSLMALESSVLLGQHAAAESMLAKRFGTGGRVTAVVNDEDEKAVNALEAAAKHTNDVLVPLVRVSSKK
jgi:signal peptide peptidase SppA